MKPDAPPPSPSWWHRQPTQITPLDALRITADHLERGEAVPAPAARLVAAALRSYLRGADRDLLRSLGLRPARGRRHAPEEEARQARDRHILALFEAQPGKRTHRAKQVAALLADPAREVTEEQVMAHLLALRREHGCDLPRSWESVLRLANAAKD